MSRHHVYRTFVHVNEDTYEVKRGKIAPGRYECILEIDLEAVALRMQRNARATKNHNAKFIDGAMELRMVRREQ